VPLAAFLEAEAAATAGQRAVLMEEADKGVQDALLRFPSFLPMVASKCGARLRPGVEAHPLFQPAV
jgi:hypothetical protein